MTFEKDEVDYARVHGFKNAVLRLLSLRSRTLWRMTDCGVGIELVPPHATVIVCEYDLQNWQEWLAHGIAVSCRLHLRIESLMDKEALSGRQSSGYLGPVLLDSMESGQSSYAAPLSTHNPTGSQPRDMAA